MSTVNDPTLAHRYAPTPIRGARDVCLRAALAVAVVSSVGLSTAHAATWSSTDATTTEAITNAPPQRDTPAETARQRRSDGERHRKSSKPAAAPEHSSSRDTVIGTETVVTTTLPGPGRSANTVTIGAPQIMLQSATTATTATGATGAPTAPTPGTAGAGMVATPCVPIRFAMGSPPQGESSQVDSWYCPQGQNGSGMPPPPR